MTMPPLRRRHLLASLALPSPALAQGGAPIRIIVPFGPGSGTDVTLRMLLPRMPEYLGQPLLIENRPGAGGTIGTDVVAKRPADGSLFVHPTLSSIGIAAALYRRLPHGPIRDLAPIAATGHLARAKLVTRIGARAVHVPCRSGAETMTALVAGQIHFLHDMTGLLLPHHQTGTVCGPFVTSDQRSPLMPDVAKLREAAVPHHPACSWSGLSGPVATPRAVQDEDAGRRAARPCRSGGRRAAGGTRHPPQAGLRPRSLRRLSPGGDGAVGAAGAGLRRHGRLSTAESSAAGGWRDMRLPLSGIELKRIAPPS